jgi:hypothetical protein
MAEHILISRHDGGTGASSCSGFKGTGKGRLGIACRGPNRVKEGGAHLHLWA